MYILDIQIVKVALDGQSCIRWSNLLRQSLMEINFLLVLIWSFTFECSLEEAAEAYRCSSKLEELLK